MAAGFFGFLAVGFSLQVLPPLTADSFSNFLPLEVGL
jgi:hypothetical protein